MVSPFAVRLATHTVASVGKTAGTLYALSTLGSIAGTMLTTFVLIPSIGAGDDSQGAGRGAVGDGGGDVSVRQSRGRRAAVVAVAVGAAGAAAYAINPRAACICRRGASCWSTSTRRTITFRSIDVGRAACGELRFDRYIESAIRARAAVSRA